jgi:hypothetical protein
MNEWERIYSVVERIEDGKFVSPKDRDAVAGVTRRGHLGAHARLFARHVIPRDRKYASNPGEPKSWSGAGSFFDVSLATIRSVVFRDDGCAEVITDWGYMLPGGQTMFVVKRMNDRWLIDGLKTRRGEEWETAHL